jgi:anti-sigma factor RsiW
MKNCADQGLLLQGLVDDELDAANALALEKHLATCSDCAAAYKELRGVRHVLSADDLRFRAPAYLEGRLLAAIDEGAAKPASNAAAPFVERADHGTSAYARTAGLFRRSARAGSLRWAAPALAVAASLALFMIVPRDGGNTRLPLQGELVSDHVRSLLANHLTDVTTSDQHTVKPWFAGKLDFSPPVIDLTDRNFPLVGGRLDYLGGRVVAALVYRRNKHFINLFVWPASRDTEVMGAEHEGYNLLHWAQAGLTFWAVSDVNATELQEFREDFAGRAPT